MSFTGNQKIGQLAGISTKANLAVQTAFVTINVARGNVHTGLYADVTGNSNTDILYLRGAGVSATTNTNQRTLTLSTTSDLRVSRNSAMLAADSWTSAQTPIISTYGMLNVTWSPELGLFVGVHSTGATYYSRNGADWEQGTGTNTWYGVTWSPELGLFVACGSGSTFFGSSLDGINFTLGSVPSSNQWRTIIWVKELGLFVAGSTTGTTNRIMTSPTGTANTWTVRTTASHNVNGIAWSKELGILVAGSSGIMSSPTGVTWTTRYATGAPNKNAIAWSSELGLFAAVGNEIVTSPNGINWTVRSLPAGSDGLFEDVIWVPEFQAFVAVTVSAAAVHPAMISFDGINWIGLVNGINANWRSLIWAPEQGILVAAGDSPGAGLQVMTSNPVGLWGGINTRLSRAQVMSRLSVGV